MPCGLAGLASGMPPSCSGLRGQWFPRPSVRYGEVLLGRGWRGVPHGSYAVIRLAPGISTLLPRFTPGVEQGWEGVWDSVSRLSKLGVDFRNLCAIK